MAFEDNEQQCFASISLPFFDVCTVPEWISCSVVGIDAIEKLTTTNVDRLAFARYAVEEFCVRLVLVLFGGTATVGHMLHNRTMCCAHRDDWPKWGPPILSAWPCKSPLPQFSHRGPRERQMAICSTLKC